ncbi:hypothetical protein SLA2020_496470 [Shorea laevis]
MGSFELCFFFILSSPVLFFAAVESCGGSCGGQDIRFPFKLSNQPERCGYPGFHLSCKNSQAILTLPSSGKFTVQSIDYRDQTIRLNDPDHCVSKRLLKSFTLSGSPFQALYPQNFTFFNCSSDGTSAGSGAFGIVNSCLSNGNYTVVAIPTDFYGDYGYGPLQSCSEIATVVAPVVWPVWSDPSMGIKLTWKEPNCRSCERRGGSCQFASDSGLGVRCSGGLSNGISKRVKYALIFGLGGPLLFILGITFLLRRKISGRYQSSSVNSDTISSSVALGSASAVKGLDGQTIESYPITVLGASRRLPKPSDNTCSICLSEYQAKETLRTLPDCQHYFHANCLDGWLRLNGTCPLCRNTPEV